MKENFTTLISCHELHEIYQKEDVILIDCTYYLVDFDKGRREYMQAHIPGAFFLDILHDLSGPLITGGHRIIVDPFTITATI